MTNNTIKPKLKFQTLGNHGKADWIKSNEFVDYENATNWMKAHVNEIHNSISQDTVWLLEHNNVFSGGTSAKKNELIDTKNIPVVHSGRGGQWTWHGPGQRIIYIMLNLNKRKRDVRLFVYSLEECIIRTLLHFNISGFRRKDFPGVWVKNENKLNNFKFNKIAAVGIRISRWITFHGVSVNINPLLEFYKGIIPCGVTDGGITSMKELGVNLELKDFDKILIKSFDEIFYNYS